MNKPLSNEEIEQAIGPCVILYSDLEKYPTIQNLLPRNGDYVVILVREKKNSGHWFLLYRKGLHHYVYFNSYGYKWDTQMKEVLSKEAIDSLRSDKFLFNNNLRYSTNEWAKVKRTKENLDYTWIATTLSIYFKRHWSIIKRMGYCIIDIR